MAEDHRRAVEVAVLLVGKIPAVSESQDFYVFTPQCRAGIHDAQEQSLPRPSGQALTVSEGIPELRTRPSFGVPGRLSPIP